MSSSTTIACFKTDESFFWGDSEEYFAAIIESLCLSAFGCNSFKGSQTFADRFLIWIDLKVIILV